MASYPRRRFLSLAGLGLLPSLLSKSSAWGSGTKQAGEDAPARPVRFSGDGEMFTPEEYLRELEVAAKKGYTAPDRYGAGGAVAAIEKRFIAETGKEAAIFLPTGTLANNLAVSLLSEERSKVFVQDLSHLYRDEADAAQTVFNKRLMPLATGKAYFTAAELKAAVEGLPAQEVFSSGVGAVSVECPVRRADGAAVPVEELQRISKYCREAGLPLHLDGARLYIASAYTGIPVKQYASLFDTVYISLYKYFGAGAGAVLAGPKAVIDRVPHLLKVHGGAQYQNWTNAAMALHRMDGFTDRMARARLQGDALAADLNGLRGIRITAVPQGTNMFRVDVDGRGAALRTGLRASGIWLPVNDGGAGWLAINETILHAGNGYIVDAFKKALK